MFGYIRPFPGELKVSEFERYKACYCGLCRALSEKYGISASFVLSYDLVFLVMLLWDENTEPVIKRKRCAVSLCRKKCYCARTPALDKGAAISIILAWQKLRDEIADESFLKTIPHRIALLFLKKAYKKAAGECKEFDLQTQAQLSRLAEFEALKSVSIDETADSFSKILSSAADMEPDETKRRALAELLYHTGRWIYIIDAFDDYKKDVSADGYNPLVLRYPPSEGDMPSEGAERIMKTMIHSSNLVCSAFELLPDNPWSRIVHNIIYLGMPNVLTRVSDGTWRKLGARHNPDT